MRRPSPILTKKDGEPSIHVKQKAVFTGAIIAGVVLTVVFGIVSSRKCDDKKTDTAPQGTSAPSGFTLGESKQQRGGLEFQLGEKKSIKPLSQEELAHRLKMTKESQQGKDIQKVFREEVSKRLKKEKYMATPAQVWRAPPGVQPGTLKSPPIGYTRVESGVDRFPMDQPRPAAKYEMEPENRFTKTLYVDADGATQMGPNYSQTDNAINQMMPPYTRENQTGERAIAEERGTTDHSFSSSNNLEDGITGETWNGSNKDWSASKEETKAAMMKISDMFDSLLKDTIFSSLEKVERTEDGWFQIKEGTDCVSIERYYEYVSNTIAAQMGAEPTSSMNWAQGSNIRLGFENIDKSVPDLRKGLKWQCANAPAYKKQEDGTYISSQTNEEIAYTVIWPRDNSVLYVHRAMAK